MYVLKTNSHTELLHGQQQGDIPVRAVISHLVVQLPTIFKLCHYAALTFSRNHFGMFPQDFSGAPDANRRGEKRRQRIKST